MNTSLRIHLICLLACFLSSYGSLQAQDHSFVHPSANVGWSVANLKQDNNLFTGATNISVPIYSFGVGDLKLPIGLSYNTRAIKPDQLPSWVGLGWNLAAAGQISRVVNGKPDELRETKSTSATIIYYSSIYDITNPIPNVITTELFTENDFAYITNYGMLANANWNTNNYLFGTLNTMPVVEASPNTKTYIDQDGQYPPNTVLAPQLDLTRNYDFQPDEFDFSMPGGGGKFYMNHLGDWVCETNQGNYKVTPLIATNVPRGTVIAPRVIYGFELTAPNGIKYIFGGTTQDKLANTEFWRGPSSINPTGIGTDLFSPMGNTFLNVCPSSWHLRRIETPDNDWVNFTYRKGALQLQYSDAPWGEGTNTTLTLSQPGYINQSLAEPWYLTQITTSNGLTIDFIAEDSHQLGTDRTIIDFGQYSTFVKYLDIVGYVGATNNMQKLNSIEVKNGSNLIKKFQFEYIENMTERLKLQSVQEMQPGSSLTANKYQFTYNTVNGKLPNYGSGLTDHFGFYNNKHFFTNPSQVSYTMSRVAFESQYNASRAPDFNYAKSESLDKVYFPSGGYRQYIYEPHEYARSISRWPFSFNEEYGNKITGGIRIAKIIDYNDDASIVGESEFIYKTEAAGTTSSGVLGMLQPQYTEDKPGGGYYFSTRGYIPIDRQESHIAYSTVFEKKPDGSMIKYEFANYDNTANDVTPFFESNGPAFWDKEPYTDNGFKRGMLKKKVLYDNAGIVVQQTTNKYQDEFDDYSRYIRSVRLKHGDQATGNGYRVAAYPQYYFPNLPRYSKNETFTTTGAIVDETERFYDNYNNLVTEQTSNSLGRLEKVMYKYPYHFYTNDVNNPYKKLTDANRVSMVIEQNSMESKNGSDYVKMASITDFGDFGNNMIKPKTVYSFTAEDPVITTAVANTQYDAVTGGLLKDTRFAVANTFAHYDSKGNVLEVNPINGINESVLWGYNNMHAIAKCSNANIADIAATSFETQDKGQFSYTGTTVADVNAPTGSMVYQLATGAIAKLSDAGKTYIISLWAKGGTVTVNGTAPTIVGKTRKGYTLYEYKISNTTVITIAGNSEVDEVRLFPQGALMTTSTYYPFVGLSSQTDAYNRTAFYQYDKLERLVSISDENGNIIKTYEYNAKQ